MYSIDPSVKTQKKIHIHIQIRIHTYTDTCIHICTYTLPIPICIYLSIHLSKLIKITYTYTYPDTHIFIYVHTYTNTYTYTCTWHKFGWHDAGARPFADNVSPCEGHVGSGGGGAGQVVGSAGLVNPATTQGKKEAERRGGRAGRVKYRAS
jgi:hypothetical protein